MRSSRWRSILALVAVLGMFGLSVEAYSERSITDRQLLAQVLIDDNYLRGTWVGAWTLYAATTFGSGSIVNQDTVTFKSDGKFERTVRATNMPASPTTYQEGTYTISGDSVVIRGTYIGGTRAGQTTSITLKATGEGLEATIRPPQSGPIVFTYNKVK